MMFFFEYAEIKMNGIKSYMKNGWNSIDILTPPIYFVFCSLKTYYHPIVPDSDIDRVLMLLKVAILCTTVIKISWFQKIRTDLGLLQKLLFGVFKALIPFLAIYFLWILFFAMVFSTLDSNKSIMVEYSGMN